jgi:hypothetical protein
MDSVEFHRSLASATPPDTLSPLLKALWLDRKGDWAGSHDIAQDIDTPDAAWVHAYLHRKEGDLWNADYWYRRAGRNRPAISLEREWDELVNAFLSQA